MLEDIDRQIRLVEAVCVRSVQRLAVLEIEEDSTRGRSRDRPGGTLAIQDDGAEAITLGCAGMGPVERTVAQELSDVPVIDGVVAAVKAAEALAGEASPPARSAPSPNPEPKRNRWLRCLDAGAPTLGSVRRTVARVAASG